MSDNVQVRGLREARARVHAIAARARDVSAAWPAVGDAVADTADEAFRTGGASTGKTWAPLTPPYRRWKFLHGMDPQTLVRTGELRDAYTARPYAREVHQPQRATFGPGVPFWARFHHRGSRGGQVPARPAFVVTDELEQTASDVLRRYIVEGLIK